jgi:hypothetical protein
MTVKPSHPIKDASSGGQESAGTKEVGAVYLFPVHVVNPHVQLGATSQRAISALGRDGSSCHGEYLVF